MGLYRRLEAIEMVLVLNENGKAALEAKKAEYANLLDALYNDGEGTAAGILTDEAYNTAKSAMSSAVTEEDLQAAYDTAKASLMSVAEHDLYVAKQNAINTLKATFPADEYTVWADELKTELDLAIERINACTTTNAVANTTTSEIERIEDAVMSDEANEDDLIAAKNEFKKAIIDDYMGLRINTNVEGKKAVQQADGTQKDVTFMSLVLDNCNKAFDDQCLTAAVKGKEVRDYLASGNPKKVVLDELKKVLKDLAKEYYNNGNEFTSEKGDKYLIATADYNKFIKKVEDAGKTKSKDDTNILVDKDPKDLLGLTDLKPICDEFNTMATDAKDDDGKRFEEIKELILDSDGSDGEFDKYIASLGTKDFKEKIKDGKVEAEGDKNVDFGFGMANYLAVDSIADAVGKAKIAIRNAATQAELDKAFNDAKTNVLVKVKEYVASILKAHYDAPEETRLPYALSDSDYRSLVAELNSITELDPKEGEEETGGIYNFFKKAIKAMVKQQGVDIAEDVTVETKSTKLNNIEGIKGFLGTGEATVKSVADLQADNVVITGPRYDKDGKVANYDLTSGTLHYVKGFDKYSSTAEKQNGNYLALYFENPSASKISGKAKDLDGSDESLKLSSEKEIVADANGNGVSVIIKMSATRKLDITIDYEDALGNKTTAVYHIDGSKLTCEAE